jgi:hypothetical protein
MALYRPAEDAVKPAIPFKHLERGPNLFLHGIPTSAFRSDQVLQGPERTTDLGRGMNAAPEEAAPYLHDATCVANNERVKWKDNFMKESHEFFGIADSKIHAKAHPFRGTRFHAGKQQSKRVRRVVSSRCTAGHQDGNESTRKSLELIQRSSSQSILTEL